MSPPDGHWGPLRRLAATGRLAAQLASPGAPVCLPWQLGRLGRALGGRVEVLEEWPGETADYARVRAGTGAGFVKYRPALDFSARAYRRFVAEGRYLRDLAPLVDVPYARVLHAAHDDRTRKAHLALEDLSERAQPWHDLGEPERHAALPAALKLLAHFHSAWLGHPALSRLPAWDRAREAARWPQPSEADELLPAQLRRDLDALRRQGQPLLGTAQLIGLIHGDLHFGQLLQDREWAERLYLIDYQHVRPAPIAYDLAHLLTVRLSWFERRSLQDALTATYLNGLRGAGLNVSEADWRREYRVGVALNLLGLWRRSRREPGPLFHDLLRRVHLAWRELG